MKYDVVLPTLGEWSLIDCIYAIKKTVDINRLILVTTDECLSKLLHPIFDGAEIVVCNEKGVGSARRSGLKHVKSSVHICIDSDVIVNREWYNYCKKTIVQSDVAACQGWEKSVGAYGNIYEKYLKKDSSVYWSLGATFLRTNLVRKVGIPNVTFMEDKILREKLIGLGYKWISNKKIVCTHLRSDVDVWRHEYHWIKVKGYLPPQTIIRLGYYTVFGWLKYPTKENIVLIGINLYRFLGLFVFTAIKIFKQVKKMKLKMKKLSYK